MKRLRVAPRHNWQQKADELGFIYHTPDGAAYWDESVCYCFSLNEIEQDLELPTTELWSLCQLFVDRAVRDQSILERLGIPTHAWDLIAESWRRHDPTLYGRFDFSYDGVSSAKLLEFNADTPTSIFEAAVFQWFWYEDKIRNGDLSASCDQFNSMHEKLVARLKAVVKRSAIHFSCMTGSKEDLSTTLYLAECAKSASLQPSILDIREIGLKNDQYVDLYDNKIDCLFKLYPWEFMLSDEFGHSRALFTTQFIEPPWKMLLSNKGSLALLWEMEPGHPNLLPTFIASEPNAARCTARFARKPIWSREGANVTLADNGKVIAATDGSYGNEGYVVQSLAMLPRFDGNFPVIGCWVIGDDAAGLGIREDTSPITGDNARFVPHYIA